MSRINGKDIIQMIYGQNKAIRAYFAGNIVFQVENTPDVPDDPDVPVLTGFSATGTSIGSLVRYNGVDIGVIIVDDSITGDGSIRIISLDNMSAATPATGTNTLEKIYCPTQNLYLDKTFYNRFSGPKNVAYTSGTQFVDGFADYKVMIDYVDSVESNEGWKTSTSISDNTSNKTRTTIPAAMACYLYTPVEDLKGYWYLPSYHELTITSQNLTAVNAGFASASRGNGKILDGSTRNSFTHWSSRYDYQQSSWGGNCCKYYITGGSDTTQYYGVAVDPGIASACLKLNWSDKSTLTLSLDGSYKIQ